MGKRTFLVALAMIALIVGLLAGHAKRPLAAPPKNYQWGIIPGGKTSRHVLGDGRVCTITPMALANGHINLVTTVTQTNLAHPLETALTIELPGDATEHAFTYAVDPLTTFTVSFQVSTSPASAEADATLVADMNTITNVILRRGQIFRKVETGRLGSPVSLPIIIGTNAGARNYIATWDQSRWRITPISQ